MIVGVNVGVNDQEMTKKRPRNDQEETKKQIEILLTESQIRIIEEMLLNNQITIRELSKKLQYGSTKIKLDIKYLRENQIISRAGSTKSGHWEVIK